MKIKEILEFTTIDSLYEKCKNKDLCIKAAMLIINHTVKFGYFYSEHSTNVIFPIIARIYNEIDEELSEIELLNLLNNFDSFFNSNLHLQQTINGIDHQALLIKAYCDNFIGSR